MDGALDGVGARSVKSQIDRFADGLFTRIELHARRVDEDVVRYVVVIDDVHGNAALDTKLGWRELPVKLTHGQRLCGGHDRRAGARKYRQT